MQRVLAAAVLSLTVAACATPQSDALRIDSGALPVAAAVKEPTFFAQRTRECGPAALAMILVQSGVATDADALVREVYNPGREGSLAPAIVAGARRHGRIAYPVNTLADLFAEIDAGRPVLVLQNLALDWIPRWHYAVAVAYDLPRDTIVLHSGTTPFYEMPLGTFERTWRRGDYFGLAALRPGEFPARDDPFRYLTAVAGVERAGRTETAAAAYASAAARWPDNPVAHLGLGNTQYALGNRRAAADAYRTAVRQHPDSADAHNNLAHVLSELGEFGRAEEAALQAVALGGANIGTYRETLRAIRQARGQGARVGG